MGQNFYKWMDHCVKLGRIALWDKKVRRENFPSLSPNLSPMKLWCHEMMEMYTH